MNSRERFLEVMRFNPKVRTLKWEFGYWGATLKRWYAEGMPEDIYPVIPTRIETVSSSLYTTVWSYEWQRQKTLYELYFGERERKIVLPDGIAVWGGALYWPSQGFPLDHDVAGYFGFDRSTALVKVEQLVYPHFEPAILDEDEDYITYNDIDGVTRKFQKREAVIPPAIAWPIHDWDTWTRFKEERLSLDDIRARFPKNWPELVQSYKQRDYPLSLGGYPCGLYGTPTHLLGYVNLYYLYYDDPALVHDILNHLTDLWIAIWEEVLADIDVDVVHIWEDISSGKGSMVSPKMFEEFMSPCYRRITDFLKGKGVDVILVDTDGDCRQLIPLFLDAGITGLYPMEVSAGMDVVAARKAYPTLQIMGGVPKSDIALGTARIDEFLDPVDYLLAQGGYVPFGDHLIPPEVPWQYFKYYREKLNRLIDGHGQARNLLVAGDTEILAMAGNSAAQAVVGVFGIGLAAYWPQFEGLKERLEGYQRQVEARLVELGAQVVSAGLVDTAPAAQAAGERFARADVDFIVCYVGTYATSSQVLPAVQRRGAPVLVLNLQPAPALDYPNTDTGEWLAHCSACCVPEISNAFARSGIRFNVVSGLLGPAEGHAGRYFERAWAEIGEWVSAAGVMRALSHSHIGFLGHTYPGMLDMYSDFTMHHAQLGAHVEVLEMDDLQARGRRG